MGAFGYDDNNDISVLSLNGPAVYGTISISTSAVEAKVGGSPLSGRVTLILQPKANGIFYGFDNSVTTSTGIELFKNQVIELDVTEDVTVYLIADSGTNDLRIQEIGQTY